MFHPDLFQDFDFSTMQRSEPSRPGEWFIFNASGEDIPPHSLGEVVGICDYDGTGTVGPLYKVVKPTDDSLKQIIVIEQPLATDKIGTGTVDSGMNGLIVAYDEEDGNGDPSPGDTLGSQSGSWRGKVGHEGLVIMAIDNSVGVMGKRAFCHFFNGC